MMVAMMVMMLAAAVQHSTMRVSVPVHGECTIVGLNIIHHKVI